MAFVINIFGTNQNKYKISNYKFILNKEKILENMYI